MGSGQDKAENFRAWGIFKGEAIGNSVRRVPDEEILRWRRIIRAEEKTPAQIAEECDWSEWSVRKYAYRSHKNCKHLDEIEPPVDKRPFTSRTQDGRPIKPIELSDEEVWRQREEKMPADWEEQLGFFEGSVSRHLRKRGWRFKVEEGITQAPCKRCERKNVPVNQLSSDRNCLNCQAAVKSMGKGSILSREELRKEKEAYLTRRKNRGYSGDSPPS